MSTFIPPTPAATKSAEQHEEPSEQDSFNHLLYKVLRLTSEQVQDLNGWMKHRGIPNVHEIIVQTFATLMHFRMICSSSEKANHATFNPM